MRPLIKRLTAGAALLALSATVALAACADDDQASQQIQPIQQQQQAQAVQAQPQQNQPQQQQQPQPQPVVQQQTQPEPQQAQQPQQQPQPAQQQQIRQPEEAVPDGARLITLFGDLTEIVYALGAGQHLVGRDTSSIYPPEAQELPNLGFTGGLNAEAILELRPTLVLGNPLAGPPGVLEQLEQAGVTVMIVEELKTLDAAATKIRWVGEALGVPQRAEALALDVEARLAEVLAAAETDEPLSVLHVYVRRGGLQLVSGEGNEAQAIIEAAGGIDAGAEAGFVGWELLTPEALVAADPDVYLVMDLGLQVVGGIEGLMAIPGMAETKAGRHQRIISMSDLYLLGFGPRLPEAIADLAAFLNQIRAEINAGG